MREQSYLHLLSNSIPDFTKIKDGSGRPHSYSDIEEFLRTQLGIAIPEALVCLLDLDTPGMDWRIYETARHNITFGATASWEHSDEGFNQAYKVMQLSYRLRGGAVVPRSIGFSGVDVESGRMIGLRYFGSYPYSLSLATVSFTEDAFAPNLSFAVCPFTPKMQEQSRKITQKNHQNILPIQMHVGKGGVAYRIERRYIQKGFAVDLRGESLYIAYESSEAELPEDYWLLQLPAYLQGVSQ